MSTRRSATWADRALRAIQAGSNPYELLPTIKDVLRSHRVLRRAIDRLIDSGQVTVRDGKLRATCEPRLPA